MLLLAVIMMLMSPLMYAESLQGFMVSGKVNGAADGSALPGVNVLLKGGQEGTITDINGDYSIEVTDENAVLVFRYPYRIQQVAGEAWPEP